MKGSPGSRSWPTNAEIVPSVARSMAYAQAVIGSHDAAGASSLAERSQRSAGPSRHRMGRSGSCASQRGEPAVTRAIATQPAMTGDPVKGKVGDRRGHQPGHGHDHEPEPADRDERDDDGADGDQEREADQDLIDGDHRGPEPTPVAHGPESQGLVGKSPRRDREQRRRGDEARAVRGAAGEEGQGRRLSHPDDRAEGGARDQRDRCAGDGDAEGSGQEPEGIDHTATSREEGGDDAVEQGQDEQEGSALGGRLDEHEAEADDAWRRRQGTAGPR